MNFVKFKNIKEITNVEVLNRKNGRFSTFYVFGYDKNGKNVIARDSRFKPYLYINNEQELNLNDEVEIGQGPVVTKPLKKCIKSIEQNCPLAYDGTAVKRITFKNLAFFKAAKNLLHYKNILTWEDDILFVLRYIIDNNIQFTTKQHVSILDIETNMSVDAVNAPEPIIALTVFDTRLNKYISWAWREDRDFSVKNFEEDWEVRIFNDEVTMLNDYIQYIEESNPAILSGWNSDWFDYFYLITRMKNLNIDYTKLSPIRAVTHFANDRSANKQNERVLKIRGRSVIDIKRLYQKFIYRKPKRGYNNLDSMAEREGLGFAKIDIGNISQAWRNNFEQLIKYNKRDVEITKAIKFQSLFS